MSHEGPNQPTSHFEQTHEFWELDGTICPSKQRGTALWVHSLQRPSMSRTKGQAHGTTASPPEQWASSAKSSQFFVISHIASAGTQLPYQPVGVVPLTAPQRKSSPPTVPGNSAYPSGGQVNEPTSAAYSQRWPMRPSPHLRQTHESRATDEVTCPASQYVTASLLHVSHAPA